MSDSLERLFLFKSVLIGDSAVGKSTLIERMITGEFMTDFQSTIGVAPKEVDLYSLPAQPRIMVWDVGGQDRFKSITPQFYKGATGAQAVFGLNDASTLFNIMHRWHPEYRENATEMLALRGPFIIMGNKEDLETREVSFQEGCDAVRSLDADYLETSAKTGMNVTPSFHVLGVKMMYEAGESDLSSAYANLLLKSHVCQSASIRLIAPPAYENLTPLELGHMIHFMEEGHYQEFLGCRMEEPVEKTDLASRVCGLDADSFPEYREMIVPQHAYDAFVASIPAFQPAYNPEYNLIFRI